MSPASWPSAVVPLAPMPASPGSVTTKFAGRVLSSRISSKHRVGRVVLPAAPCGAEARARLRNHLRQERGDMGVTLGDDFRNPARADAAAGRQGETLDAYRLQGEADYHHCLPPNTGRRGGKFG